MNINSVIDSIEKVFFFLKAFEVNRSNLKSLIIGGEPMLGKRNLYPTINSSQTRKIFKDTEITNHDQLNLLLKIISLIDGKRKLKEVVEFLDDKYGNVLPIIEELIKKKLIKNI